MGYTHYYKFKKNPRAIENGAEKFANAVNATKICIGRLPKRIYYTYTIWNEETSAFGIKKRKSYRLYPMRGGNGYGEPVFKPYFICFNGDEEHGQGYETFHIDFNNNFCTFCKTARQPYDVAVCIALLCFKHYFGDDFNFRSDGDIEKGECGWKRAKRITEEYFADEFFENLKLK